MCQGCQDDLDEAEQLLALADQLDAINLAEGKSGDGAGAGYRNLTAAERKAKVKFGDLAADLDATEAEVTAALNEAMEVGKAALAAALLKGEKSVAPAVLQTRFLDHVRNVPANVWAKIDAAAGKLVAAFVKAARLGSQRAIEEAKRQKYPTKGIGILKLPEEVFEPMANLIAHSTVSRVHDRFERDVMTPARMASPDPFTKDEVSKALEKIDAAGPVDKARQVGHQARAVGRNETAAELNPARIYASELLDGATCRNCEKIDGTEYKTIEEAHEDYPSGYYACYGQERCRGTLVFIYSD